MTQPPTNDALWVLDILTDGSSRVVTDPNVNATPDDTVRYRWVHMNLEHPPTKSWLETHLPKEVAHTKLQVETRPRCQVTSGGLLLNFRGVNFNTGQDPDDMVSIRLWVTSRVIVTTETRRLKSIDEIHAACVDQTPPTSPCALVADLVRALSIKIETASVTLDDRTDQIEDMIETTAVSDLEIAQLRRTANKLYRYIAPQSEALKHLLSLEDTFFSTQSIKSIATSSNQLIRTLEELHSVKDRLKIITDFKDMQQAKRQSNQSTILSIIAAIFLPLGFITGLFGVNIGGMPGVNWDGAFWALTLGSLVSSGILLMIFRRLKWL